MDAVSAIKERLTIEDIVGEYVTLQRAGRNYKGLCPFHTEKTPSFMVNPDRAIYHCFGCNEGGDVISFVMKVEGLDFKAALEILARKSGVDLSQYGGGSGQQTKKKEKAITLLELATKYYQTCLVNNPHALDYARKSRSLTADTLNQFRIGYAPNSGRALIEFLKKRGFSREDLQTAGLITSRGSVVKDIFRGRLILPLMDGQGRVVGFTGRLIDPDALGPKYLNSPQTVAYDKSRNVFGLHLAKQAIREKGRAVLVEGNMDVVASHQAGVNNVVATAGTAMTVEQLRQLSRLASTVVLAFDNDSAGLNATLRSINLSQKIQVTIMVAPITGGKDPDDLIQQSPAAWQKVVDEAQYALDWLFEHYQSTVDTKTAPGKRQLSSFLLPVIKQLQDPVEQEHYMKRLAEIMDVSLEAVQRRMTDEKPTRQPTKKAAKTDNQNRLPAEDEKLMDTYLALLVRYPRTRVSMKAIEEIDLSSLRQKIWQYMTKQPAAKADQMVRDLPDAQDFVKILVFKAEELYGAWEAKDRVVEAISLAQRLGIHTRRKNLKAISEKIEAAEAVGDQRLTAQLLETYQTLLRKE